MTVLQDCLDLQVPKVVKLSPDGAQVVYSTNLLLGHRKGKNFLSTIWLAETGKEHSARQLTSGLFNDNTPRWAPDGQSVAFLSDRADAGKSSAIYILPLGGGEPYPITPVENERGIAKFEFSPDGKFIAFLSPDEKTPERKKREEDGDDAEVWGEDWPFNRLRIVHVATNRIETVVSRNSHLTNFAWSADGKAIAFFEVQTPDIESPWLYGIDVSILDVAKREDSKLSHIPNRAESPFVWVGPKLYFIGSAVAGVTCSANAVCTIDTTAKEPKCEIYSHGETDCASDIGPASHTPTVMVQDGLEDQIRILNGKTLFSEAKRLLAWDVASANSDNPIIAIAQGDINNPAEIYTLSPSSKPTQLSTHGAAFSNTTLGHATHLHLKSSDNADDLDGLYLTPSSHTSSTGTPTTPLPTVVAIHGGPYFRITNAFDPLFFYWTPALLAAGYGILLPNYRGGSSHGEAHAKYARAGMGKQDYDDIITFTQHAIEQRFADKEKLIVAGYSQGGFLSYLSAVRNGLHDLGWKFAAAIPGAGVADWGSLAQSSDVGVVEAEMAGAGPWSNGLHDTSDRAASALYGLKHAAEKGGVVPPMLILHGAKDVRVPLEQASGFRRGLAFWGLGCEFVIYPREDHVFKEQVHIRDMVERIVKFCDRHLG